MRTAHRPNSLVPAGIGALALLTLLPTVPAAAAPAQDPAARTAAQAPHRLTTQAERRTDARLDALQSDPARLKDLARASLEYAFLDGDGLWATGSTRAGYRPVRACAGARPGIVPPAPDCVRHLESDPKAATQWRQEAAFAGFERRYGGSR